jgi:hypothetical protein
MYSAAIRDSPDVAQQRVVLHVPRADLEDVGVFGHDVDLARLHHLGDDREAGPIARFGKVPKGLDTQALEGVRARPRLERAASQDRGAGRLDRIGGLEQLLTALDRAGSGHHRQRSIADRRVQDPDHRVLRMELARCQLEWPADRGHGLDARHRREAFAEDGPPASHLTDDCDNRVVIRHVVERRHPLGQDLALDAEDLGLRGSCRHHDEHLLETPSVGCSQSFGQTKKQR